MDPDLILIFAFVTVITIIIGATVNGIVKKVLDYKRSKPGKAQSVAQVSDLSERTSLIEDRLKVLERIATDPEARRGTELAQEIEQLRIEQREKEPG